MRFSTIPALFLLVLCSCLLPVAPAAGQEKPYFVTYSHDLEEPGNLEIENKTALARPDGANHYGAAAVELEYGARGWWTTELYLDGQATARDSAIGMFRCRKTALPSTWLKAYCEFKLRPERSFHLRSLGMLTW